MPKRDHPDARPEIGLSVVDQDENRTFYRVKMNTPLNLVINSYNQKHKHDSGVLTFLYNGNRISGKDTPAKLGMEDEDEIAVMEHRIGGSLIIANPT